MKKIISGILILIITLSSTTLGFAATESNDDNYTVDRINGDAVNTVLNNHVTTLGLSAENEDVIDDLLNDYQLAKLSGATEQELNTIELKLSNYGVIKLTDEDFNLLFSGRTSVVGPPTAPSATKYVDYFLRKGRCNNSNYNYCNIYAQANWTPSDGIHSPARHPLYLAEKTTFLPESTKYSRDLLEKSLKFLASEAIDRIKNVPNFLTLLLGTVTEAAIDEALTTGQTVGSSVTIVATQSFVYSYIEEADNFYTHLVTAEQLSLINIYNYSYIRNGITQTGAVSTDPIIFRSSNYTLPQEYASTKIKNNDFVLSRFSVGKIELSFSTTTGSISNKSVPIYYYDEVSMIPRA